MDHSTLTPSKTESRLRNTSATKPSGQNFDDYGEEHNPDLCVTPSTRKTRSALHLDLDISDSIPLKEFLLQSSPPYRSKYRHMEKTEFTEEINDSMSSRRKCKRRTSSGSGALGFSSPRKGRRNRKRLEHDIRDEKEVGLGEDNVNLRKRRQSRAIASRKEKSTSSLPVLALTKKNVAEIDPDLTAKLIVDLIMWNDIAKSSLWFGLGCLGFLSSCFAKDISLNFVSLGSQMSLLCLAVSFFCNSVSSRSRVDLPTSEFQLKEEDVLSVIRLLLPAINGVITKTRDLFSGEPCVTVKVAPLLLLVSKYGHLITLKRFMVAGFFIGFTVPKLYSTYSKHIQTKVEDLTGRLMEAWSSCSHKRAVIASVTAVFWNISTVKTRIFVAFLFFVILRCYRDLTSKSGEIQGQQQPQDLVGVIRSKQEEEANSSAMVVASST